MDTTGVELIEAFLASNGIAGFRNPLTELGLAEVEPTILYQDNQPAIQVAQGIRNLVSKTKHLGLCVWKLEKAKTIPSSG